MLRNRSRWGRLNRAADAVLTAGMMHAARVSNWIEFLVGTKLFHGQKSRFRLPAISSGASTLEKRSYCFFPDAEAAADAVAVSFLYSAWA
jgi:hypothetical protein